MFLRPSVYGMFYVDLVTLNQGVELHPKVGKMIYIFPFYFINQSEKNIFLLFKGEKNKSVFVYHLFSKWCRTKNNKLQINELRSVRKFAQKHSLT